MAKRRTSKRKKARNFALEFDGVEQLIEKLENLGGSVEETTEKALIATHAHVTPGVEDAITPHYFSGATEESIKRSPKIIKEGAKMAVPVGFSISQGGIASIFLMYGTPKMNPDNKVYNAIMGAKVRKEVAEIQADIFAEAIVKAGFK